MQFFYRAQDVLGKVVQGNISAASRNEAISLLAKKSLKPLNIKSSFEHITTKGSLPAIEKITFCRYLSTSLSTGLSLSSGIEILREETESPLMRQILDDMKSSMEQGQPLSSIFQKYPDVFEAYFITLVKSGEISGTLADVFRHLELQIRAENELSNKVKGALLYPSVVFSAMLGIGFLMFFFVLPQIGKVFLSLKLPIPKLTILIFQLSIFLSKNFIPSITAIITTAISTIILLRRKNVQLFLLNLASFIPTIRNLAKKVDLARFTRIFGTLIKSAVPITEALEISLDSLSWPRFKKLSQILPEQVRKGKTISSSIKEQKVFPPLVTQMIAAGEESGTLDSTLTELAAFYEQEVAEELKNLTQILEPVLMLLVGIGVGAMILSIIAPIYSIVGNFQSTPPPR